jgi:uncharacterized membrane protein
LRRSIYAFVALAAGWGAATFVYRNVSAWGQGLSTGTPAPIAKVEQGMSDDPSLRGFLLPTPVELMVDRILWNVDANDEQRREITEIAERVVDDLNDLREKSRANRRQIAEALAAATIDPAGVEMLRGVDTELASKRSQRITAALIEVAEVLTPDQRATLANPVERRAHWFQ